MDLGHPGFATSGVGPTHPLHGFTTQRPGCLQTFTRLAARLGVERGRDHQTGGGRRTGSGLAGATDEAVLFIEVETATAKMPKIDGKSIFVFKSQVRQWTLDKAGNVKIVRHGFPIVPDFGGTAHAYCGTTLQACLGDLLAWHKKPTHDDMLRAYIIKSRVRETEKLLLAQPYSPALFTQGTLPGPALLMEVLHLYLPAKKKMDWVLLLHS